VVDILQLHLSDTVAVAFRNLKRGEMLPFGGGKLRILDDIPAGHKVAVCTMAKGSTVVKYGHPIGTATREISAGQWVHSHNLHSSLNGISEYSYRKSSALCRKFLAHRRILWDSAGKTAGWASGMRCGSSQRWDASVPL